MSKSNGIIIINFSYSFINRVFLLVLCLWNMPINPIWNSQQSWLQQRWTLLNNEHLSFLRHLLSHDCRKSLQLNRVEKCSDHWSCMLPSLDLPWISVSQNLESEYSQFPIHFTWRSFGHWSIAVMDGTRKTSLGLLWTRKWKICELWIVLDYFYL